MTAKTVPTNKIIVGGLKNISFGIRTCAQLLRKDYNAVFDSIPKTDITVIIGENDKFYGDALAKEYIHSKNIALKEIKNAGHDWSDELEKAIEPLLKK